MQEDGSSTEAQEGLGTEVMESLGVVQDVGDSEGSEGESEQHELPQYAKERIGKLQKRHSKEMRGLSSKVQDLESQLQSLMSNRQTPAENYQPSSPSQGMNGGEDVMKQAFAMALQHQKMEEGRAKEEQSKAHVRKQYHRLQESLDNASSKYEDFDDVVRSDDAPFTETLRDAALFLPNAPDVLYKLGKDPESLKRINNLHPLDQVKEMVNLSIALSTGSGKSDAPASVRPIGQVKNNPVTNRNVNETTSVGELRRRMRDRNSWK